MKHVFRVDESGAYKMDNGVAYDCKAVNITEDLEKGWSYSLEEAINKSKKAEKKIQAKKAQSPADGVG